MVTVSSQNRYDCGLAVLSSDNPDPNRFAVDIAREAAAIRADFTLIFFSPTLVSAGALTSAMVRHAPTLHYAGCTTAGEINPEGLASNSMVAILFPSGNFRVATAMIRNISGSGIDTIAASVRRLLTAANPSAFASNAFALCLIDGMSRAEDIVTAGVHWGLENIPLLGGSSGDDLRFETATIIRDGIVETDCAVVIIIATDIPFHIFKTTNFIQSEQKLVVTASEPERRVVHEFNAGVAADEFAYAIGYNPAELTSVEFASHPVGVLVGGEYYCRSIKRRHPDGSLSFFCAIDDGVVLSIAQPMDLVETTRAALREVEERLGGVDVVIGFDCVTRRLDAGNRGILDAVSDLYKSHKVIGFNTYGEQLRTMHLNQTLTGIAFGRAPVPG